MTKTKKDYSQLNSHTLDNESIQNHLETHEPYPMFFSAKRITSKLLQTSPWVWNHLCPLTTICIFSPYIPPMVVSSVISSIINNFASSLQKTPTMPSCPQHILERKRLSIISRSWCSFILLVATHTLHTGCVYLIEKYSWRRNICKARWVETKMQS